MELYLEWDKITHSKKTQVPRPKSQEPRPTLKSHLEFGAWSRRCGMRLDKCGNLSRF